MGSLIPVLRSDIRTGLPAGRRTTEYLTEMGRVEDTWIIDVSNVLDCKVEDIQEHFTPLSSLSSLALFGTVHI